MSDLDNEELEATRKLNGIDKENEIEVGEYVRTNQGHIGVLKRIELDENDKSLKWYVFDKKEFEINIVKEEYINKPYIVKHSKNIIDLIEEGDYVNGFLITNIFNKQEKEVWHGAYSFMDEMCFKNEDIKSIVTKEQFESVKYEV